MSACDAARDQLLDFIRARLSDTDRQRLEWHLQGCAECRRVFERERELERALGQRSRPSLPRSLEAELAARVAKHESPSLVRRALVALVPLTAAAVLVFVAGRVWRRPNDALVNEAVNDHLRVVFAAHPIEIESGGIHQVKPWFTGRVDFAPALNFSGDEEFPLQGGAVSWFIDRKAATFVFGHKLHTITLLVFPSTGFDWPLYDVVKLGPVSGTSTLQRGFHTLLWRDGDLGYVLVSDVDGAQLVRLGRKIAAH